MKARITLVFGTAVMALALAGGALAAPHQNGAKGWDYTRPSASVGWTSYDAFGHPLWPIIGFFGLRAGDVTSPAASAGWTSYNPVTVKPWNIKAGSVKGWSLRPAFSCCRIEV